MSQFTLELNASTVEKLTALAASSQQSVSQWVEQMVMSFETMQETKALIAGVQLAQQQLANGQGIEHELVKTMLFEMLNEEGVDEATDLSLEDIYQQALPRFTSIYTNGSY